MASRLPRSSGMLSFGRGASSSISSPSSPSPVGGSQRGLRQPHREVEQPKKIAQDPALPRLAEPRGRGFAAPKGLF